MKTVILCGGFGTRLGEETSVKPKPMVEIGGRPILLHIMKGYAQSGFRDFVLALGYRGSAIKEYFLNYRAMNSDIAIELASGTATFQNTTVDDWAVCLVDTGLSSMTGGRLYRLRDRLRPEGTFMLTYGDGVSDISIHDLLAFHQRHGKAATVTAVRPPARFGTMLFDGDRVAEFAEKPQTGEGWINGGFFVFESKVFDYLEDDSTVLEEKPLENLARDGELMALKHEGFWHCMDTLRDRNYLDACCAEGRAPWKTWNDA